MRIVVLVLLVLALCAATGCQKRYRAAPDAPGDYIMTFDDIHSQSKAEGDTFIPQHRYFSVNGIIPAFEAGGFMHFRPERKAVTMINLSPNGKTYLGVRTVPAADNYEPVLPQLKQLDIMAGEIVGLEFELWKARQDIGDGASQMDISDLAKELKDKKKEFREKRDVIADTLSKPGYSVIRWRRNDISYGNFKLGELFDSQAEQTHYNSGYMVINGLRTATLYAGQDFISHDFSKLAQQQKDEGAEMPASTDRKFIGAVTTLISTKSIEYTALNNIKTNFQMGLQLTVGDLNGFEDFLGDSKDLNLGLYLNTLESYASSGHMKGAKEIKVPVEPKDFGTVSFLMGEDRTLEEHYNPRLYEQNAKESGWIPFYMAFTELLDIQGLDRDKIGVTAATD